MWPGSKKLTNEATTVAILAALAVGSNDRAGRSALHRSHFSENVCAFYADLNGRVPAKRGNGKL